MLNGHEVHLVPNGWSNVYSEPITGATVHAKTVPFLLTDNIGTSGQ